MTDLIDGRCQSCGHRPEECACSCCWPGITMFAPGQPTAYQRCKTCGLHYRTGRYAEHVAAGHSRWVDRAR